ncbi:hypothetical protein J8L98_00020 [Pseudoalteromonas sp. MMG013]|uniref:hypothetical protein n=1 Tax=unclassified Pseudoalteromonas TaxID=194690 RepID=UPI001B368AE1|nr:MULTISPECIES: hypothetical protein [unclassified Pseudoalteromonas]MBQ4848248.1 hypothetical protein [Pseudoalteromonas sp. MMG005]MBQ4860073.1 hypothetical protein [Pseudoalteromonas sp. MMG013]
MNMNRGFITYALMVAVIFIIATFQVKAAIKIKKEVYPANYIILDNDNRYTATQLTLKRNGEGILKQQTRSRINWEQTVGGTVIKFDQPMIMSRFENAPNSVIRIELTQLQLIHQDDSIYQSIRHHNVVDDSSNDVIETFIEQSSVTLLEKQDLAGWHLDLVGKKWTVDGVELLTYPEQPYFSDLASASAHFISKKQGEFTFFNGEKAPFKWRIKNNKLIIKAYINGKKIKYTFWQTNPVGSVGAEFVANVSQGSGVKWHTRRGMFIEQQEEVFDLDSIVGSWHLGSRQYDHYADNITVPNIVHPGSRWELTDNGTFLRFKLTHPELGSVVDCPDDTCYLACKFTHRLIAKEGNTFYMENGVISEFEPMSPLKLNNASVSVVEFDPAHGVERFSHSWLDHATLTFNDEQGSDKLRFIAQTQADGKTNYTVRSMHSNSELGRYSVANSVLSIVTEQVTTHFKMLSFSRDQLTACKYSEAQTCDDGEVIKIDLHNGVLN